jgi:DNA-binding MarR family transcriptional regulator
MNEELGTEESIISALRRIIRVVDLHSKHLARRYGLTGPQIVLMKAIARHQPLSTGELAERCSLGQATVSQILDRLEKRGLVRRSRSSIDKRRVMNKLTEAGHKAVESSPSLLQDRFTSELNKLADWERTLILSILQRVSAMMWVDELPASPVLVSGPITASAEETADFFDGEEHQET